MPRLTAEQITAKVRAIIVDQLGVVEDTVAPETTFTALGCDSLDRIELLMAVEEEFNVQIPDDEAERMTVVRDVHEYLAIHAK